MQPHSYILGSLRSILIHICSQVGKEQSLAKLGVPLVAPMQSKVSAKRAKVFLRIREYCFKSPEASLFLFSH